MSLTAQELEELIAAGASPEVREIVTRIVTERDDRAQRDASRSVTETVTPAVTAKIRAQVLSAERSKRYRDRRKACVTPSVTETVTPSLKGAVYLEPNLFPESKVTTPQKPKRDARGTHLPEDWQPSPESYDLAKTFDLHLAYSRHLDEFRDYWRGVPGARGRKTNWEATWRNRLRAIYERKSVNGHKTQTTGIGPSGSGPSPERRAELERALYGDRRH